ncbi:unnamed protein product [Enterobius vermicularis]|uniref:Hexosyltransferase n=1 Tax=Enterobius vermicularis TaxID=51028 RepID=A0A0N4VQD2_ENTVE|nr:unnamed protein product [Enterobius vermicularis]
MAKRFEISDNLGVRLLFTLGASEDKSFDELVKKESLRYHDIIRQNFHDTYYNLTWKAIMAVRFVKEHCDNVKYILVTNDDIIMNLWEVIETLSLYSEIGKPKEELERTVFCYVIHHLKVVRNPKNKWYASRIEFPNDYYNDYCSGVAVIIPSQLISNMFKASKNAPYYKIDDYFMTGVLATKAGAKFKDISTKILDHASRKNRSGFSSGRFLFQPTGTVEQAEAMWNNLKRYYDRRQKQQKRSNKALHF